MLWLGRKPRVFGRPPVAAYRLASAKPQGSKRRRPVLVSYGGQLTDWRITQTNEFKASIPTAGISNLISYNCMTYYNQYEEMESGQFLHQENLMDLAWERSAIKHIAGDSRRE